MEASAMLRRQTTISNVCFMAILRLQSARGLPKNLFSKKFLMTDFLRVAPAFMCRLAQYQGARKRTAGLVARRNDLVRRELRASQPWKCGCNIKFETSNQRGEKGVCHAHFQSFLLAYRSVACDRGDSGRFVPMAGA